jgi:hypothetical protein
VKLLVGVTRRVAYFRLLGGSTIEPHVPQNVQLLDGISHQNALLGLIVHLSSIVLSNISRGVSNGTVIMLLLLGHGRIKLRNLPVLGQPTLTHRRWVGPSPCSKDSMVLGSISAVAWIGPKRAPNGYGCTIYR